MIEIVRTECQHEEVWKDIAGYHYEVSSYGRVRNKRNGKIVRLCKGYGMRRVVLRCKDEFHQLVAAKLVLEAFVCAQPDGCKPFCLDGNYEHLYVENLVWVERRRQSYKYKRVKPNKKH